MNQKSEKANKIQSIYVLSFLIITLYILLGNLLLFLLIPLFFSIIRILYPLVSYYIYLLVITILFLFECIFKTYFLATFAVWGIFVGEFIEKNYSAFRTITYSNLILISLFLTQYLILYSFFNELPSIKKVALEFKNYLYTYQETFLRQIDNQNFSSEEVAEIKSILSQKLKLWTQLLPSYLIIFSILYSYFYYKFLSILARYKGFSINPTKKYSHWLYPDYIALGFLGSWVLFLLFKNYGQPQLYIALLNIWYFFQFLYVICGFSIVSFFFNKFNLPLIVKVFSCFLLSLSLNMVMFLGIFDTWFDFRKLKKR